MTDPKYLLNATFDHDLQFAPGHIAAPSGAAPPAPPPPPPPKLTPHEISLITEAASKPGPNGTFQCTLCNKQFGDKNGLIRHIRLTHVGTNTTFFAKSAVFSFSWSSDDVIRAVCAKFV